MHDGKRGVSIKEVEDAVQRAIESAEWAKQMDDARALTCLRSFLTSQNAKSLLYLHLVALQPEIFGDKDEDNVLKRIPRAEVCALYEDAVHTDSSDILDVKYTGMTSLGSARYELVSCINPHIAVYIRMCRTGLRAEIREENFLIARRQPKPEPKGLTSFFKRLMNRP